MVDRALRRAIVEKSQLEPPSSNGALDPPKNFRAVVGLAGVFRIRGGRTLTMTTTTQHTHDLASARPIRSQRRARTIAILIRVALLLALLFVVARLWADETCSSPYLARIEGQEEFVYVWTLGVDGLGDGQDKLVTVDVKPGSANYGKVIHQVSVTGRHEAHHGGFTDDRRQLWLAGLESSKLFIFDVYSDPAKPRLVKTIGDFIEKSGGAVGPHGVYALPGRVLIPALSNARDKPGRTALVEYGNDGNYIATHWLPTKEEPRGASGAEFADGYGYDARVLPRKNVLLTTSFTGWKNYMTEFGKVASDPEAVKQVGDSLGLGRDAQLRIHCYRARFKALACV